jgi:general secretion pathway protein D
MKTLTLLLILLLTSLELRAQNGLPSNFQAEMAARMKARRDAMAARAAANGAPGAPGAAPGALGALPSNSPIQTDPKIALAGRSTAGSDEEVVPANTIDFQGVDVNQVLDVYAKLVHRTLLRSASLPQASIILKTETDLTKAEVIQALQAVLAMNGIEVVNVGTKFVKVGAVADANGFGAEFNQADASQLPDLGPYVTHIVQLKYLKPSVVMPLITPFAKLPNAVIAIEDNGILVLRDNAENVKRMLEMINKIDVSVPAEYISEVIPIRYAQAADIASALNSLGGSGGGTVSIGSSARSSVNGIHSGSSGFGGGGGTGGGFNGLNGGGGNTGGYGGSSGFGGSSSPYGSTGATANGTPTSGSSFADRLSSIVNRAGGGGSGAGGKGDIQVFGQTKIIADQRSNSLLIFATRTDMENIKHVINQLDVLLAQVLIEAVIMDVNIGSSFSFGTSVVQNPQNYGATAGGPITGAGGFNNGTGFLGTLTNATAAGNSWASNIGSGNGFSYFGNIGPNWDVAVNALAADNNATVIQRPRIQTSQAKPATFFVGNTVPYITGTYGGGVYGNSSSYSQLTVGVELDVTPFINPDGLVVMDINQEIDDVNGSTPIEGVGDVPDTDKRTLNSEIAVRDRDTIMLGGFIRSDLTKSRSGVPILEDIPILGALFSNKSDSKTREELVVLMRPTVLKTPEDSARQTLKEEQRLPGVSAAAADDAAYEHELIEAERKAEKERAKKGDTNGFYNAEDTILQTDRISTGTNAPVQAPAPTPAPAYPITPIMNESTAPSSPLAPGQ